MQQQLPHFVLVRVLFSLLRARTGRGSGELFFCVSLSCKPRACLEIVHELDRGGAPLHDAHRE